MKTFFLTTMTFMFLLCFTIEIQAQTNQIQTNQVVIGSKDIIYSKILNEQRKIWVYVPSSPSDTVFFKQSYRYPVIYLLDAEWNFSSVASMIERLNSGYFSVCPEMIVVGIPNTDRTRDLTPTHIDSDLELDTKIQVAVKNLFHLLKKN